MVKSSWKQMTESARNGILEKPVTNKSCLLAQIRRTQPTQTGIMGWWQSCPSFPLKICQVFEKELWNGILECGCAAKYRLHVGRECCLGKVRKSRQWQEVRKLPGGILSTLRSGFYRFSLAASKKKTKKKNIHKAFPTLSRHVLHFHLLPLPFSEGIAHQIKRWSESPQESSAQL